MTIERLLRQGLRSNHFHCLCLVTDHLLHQGLHCNQLHCLPLLTDRLVRYCLRHRLHCLRLLTERLLRHCLRLHCLRLLADRLLCCSLTQPQPSLPPLSPASPALVCSFSCYSKLKNPLRVQSIEWHPISQRRYCHPGTHHGREHFTLTLAILIVDEHMADVAPLLRPSPPSSPPLSKTVPAIPFRPCSNKGLETGE